jgi:3-oxoacyl-(acyl-carrier-protein) synthase
MTRVVVSGIGIVSPLGCDIKATLENLHASRSGIREIQSFDCTGFPVQAAGEIDDPLLPRDNSRMLTLAERAVRQAVQSSGISVGPDARRAISWSAGKQDVDLQLLTRRMCTTDAGKNGFAWPEPYTDAISAAPAVLIERLAELSGAAGEAFCCYTACASGNDALGLGKRLIERGSADLVIAGACDSQVHPLSLLEFELLDALSHDIPQRACRPFDRKRTGFVVGEGAAALVLESWGHAQKRNARIYARLAGYGSSLDCFGLTKCHPEGRGAAQAMSAALADAGLTLDDIGYINAHGTGTVLNDRAESAAIHHLWGAEAKSVPVSSTKAATGHLIASASAVEAVITMLALQHQFLPSTLNYENFDPECDLNVVAAEPRPARFTAAMSNGFGFGGQNSAIVLEAV